MRTQSLFYSRFWLGGSGNEIRKNGSDAIVTAIYLATFAQVRTCLEFIIVLFQ